MTVEHPEEGRDSTFIRVLTYDGALRGMVRKLVVYNRNQIPPNRMVFQCQVMREEFFGERLIFERVSQAICLLIEEIQKYIDELLLSYL